jgi:hypothetical protein
MTIMAAAKVYRVTGPYVTVRTMTENGPRIIGLYTGARVPDDAEQEWIGNHLRDGLIGEVGAEPPPVSAESVPEAPPASPPGAGGGGGQGEGPQVTATAEATAERESVEADKPKSGGTTRSATASRTTGKGG